jgi:hypothetical protein
MVWISIADLYIDFYIDIWHIDFNTLDLAQVNY